MKLLISICCALYFVQAHAQKFNGKDFYKPCEIQLARYINGYQFAQETGTARINFWEDDFDAARMLKSFNSKKEILESIAILKKFLDRDHLFAKNLKGFVNEAVKQKKITVSEVKTIFREKKVNASLISFNKSEELMIKVVKDPAALKAWVTLNSKAKLSKFYQKEYQRILFDLDFSSEEFELIAKHFKPNGKLEQLKEFEDYMYFIRYRNQDYRKKAITQIDDIMTPLKVAEGSIKSPVQEFKRYRIKVSEYQNKRQGRYEKRFRKENKGNLTDDLRTRAKTTAEKEAGIFKKLLAGCKGNFKSKSLRSATKKFKQFKIATSIGFGLWGYVDTNKDKLDPKHSIVDILQKEMGLKDDIQIDKEYDPYWFRRLGYEIGSGLFFTWVNNLIITNPSTSAFKKAWSGYLKFSAMDGANAWGYDHYFGGDPEQVQKQFDKLRQDPNFQKKLNEIMKEVYDKTSKTTIKKFLDDNFNMSVSTSKEDLNKITLEDLESAEAQEMILELLAERMYLDSMGSMPLFQTGSTGMDRWAFYRVYNIPNTIKSIAVDLLLFRIMCMASGPNATKLSAAKAFMLSLGIQLADKWVSTKILYPLRREAIEQ